MKYITKIFWPLYSAFFLFVGIMTANIMIGSETSQASPSVNWYPDPCQEYCASHGSPGYQCSPTPIKYGCEWEGNTCIQGACVVEPE